MITHTINSPSHRLQFKVIDLTGEEVAPAVRDPTPVYIVTTLDITYDKSTSFAVAGKVAYFGSDARAAWQTALRYVPDLATQLPNTFITYLQKWAGTQLT